ncbi:hypothetical protein SDC9_200683 [bioreactor metagenome]|uniref:Uncharacterized protein n=1 Tax=bioreactor metagenome TaxID=1076179 RepID=A0A645IPS0_9ZZZZ
MPFGGALGELLHADRDRLTLSFRVEAVVPVVVGQVDVRGEADDLVGRQSHGAHQWYGRAGTAFPFSSAAVPDGVGVLVAIKQVDRLLFIVAVGQLDFGVRLHD